MSHALSGRIVEDKASADSVAPKERVFPVGWRRLSAETFGVAALAWGLVAWLFRVWDVSLRVPVERSSGDTTLSLSFIKTIISTGWFYSAPSLGAPFGANTFDNPHGGETLQMFCFKVLALFTESPVLILNFYYLVGFGLVAAAMYLVLRHLCLSPLPSAIVSWGFAFLPYHYLHGANQLVRATYISAPVALLLLVWLAQWRSRFLHDPTTVGFGGRENIRWRRVWAALTMCVLLALWETMITMFTLVLLGTFAVVGALRWREWRRLVVGGIGIATIGLTFVIACSPSLLYWWTNGKNHHGITRSVAEAARYGLRLNGMLLPSNGSRLGMFRALANRAQLDSRQSIGFLAVAGLLGLLFAAVAGLRIAAPRLGGDVRSPSDKQALRETAATVTVVAILFGTTNGFSTFVAMAGLSQLRTWSRIGLFIAAFALIQIVLWFERFVVWTRGRLTVARARAVLIAATLLITVGTLADGPPVPRADEAMAGQYQSVNGLVAQIADTMPSGSMIMQYPTFSYPEATPPGKMTDYDPLRAYVAPFGDTFRWSYGAMKGRPQADWQKALAMSEGDAQISDLPAVLGMGFTGLWVDTFGYSKNPETLRALQERLLPYPPLRSSDGRYLFYDLRPYKSALGITDEQLRARAQQTFGIAPPGVG